MSGRETVRAIERIGSLLNRRRLWVWWLPLSWSAPIRSNYRKRKRSMTVNNCINEMWKTYKLQSLRKSESTWNWPYLFTSKQVPGLIVHDSLMHIIPQNNRSWIKFCSPPMFLHSATQGDLLPHLCAHRVSEHNLGQISFHCTNTASCRQRADVYHQHLILRQLLNL